jgi:tetratricopeptide (TPR) repeat protein
MYEAWNSTGQKRVKLALQALEISKDCADAYVLLAEESARTLEEAKDLYELGVKAGERALGPQTFEENVGYFWGMMETRPYMRARAGLAACLWQLGERQQAIEHYTDMLRLNPGDNQGLRYTLATALLEEGADEALGKLLKQYKEDAAAAWSYNYALWIFRQRGAGFQANRALKKALEANPFVPPYLLGRKRLPKRLPEYIGFGDESEAVDYVMDAISAWQKTAGALEWLAKQWAAGTNYRLPSRPSSRG